MNKAAHQQEEVRAEAPQEETLAGGKADSPTRVSDPINEKKVDEESKLPCLQNEDAMLTELEIDDAARPRRALLCHSTSTSVTSRGASRQLGAGGMDARWAGASRPRSAPSRGSKTTALEPDPERQPDAAAGDHDPYEEW